MEDIPVSVGSEVPQGRRAGSSTRRIGLVAGGCALVALAVVCVVAGVAAAFALGLLPPGGRPPQTTAELGLKAPAALPSFRQSSTFSETSTGPTSHTLTASVEYSSRPEACRVVLDDSQASAPQNPYREKGLRG